MSANTWIKTLNVRLLAEPNWAIKAGYVTALVAVAGAFVAYLILTNIFAALVWFMPIAGKMLVGMFRGWLGHTQYLPDGWRDGSHGFGEYRGGVYQTMFHDDDE